MLTNSGNRWTRLAAAAFAAAAIGLGAAGCLGLDVAGTFRWPGARTEQPLAGRMTVSWKNDMQKKAGKNMLRGFQGKVQFFAADPPKPAGKDPAKTPEANPKTVPVDGTLTVYAFEETSDGKEGTGPSKKYVFPAKDLRKVHREGPEGHEYDVWLAWDKVGGAERHIRLLARFDPAGGGQVVMSDNSREVLPGMKIQYASGQAPEDRKRPPDSAGRPISEAEFEKEVEASRDSKSTAKAADANPLDETR
ncbi:MAG TPA: hypothetical protein VFG04_25515 [Planctomycetaceae bacterium]|nr:hypothetical protein [Planctomycetaceae bacterium]